MGHHGISREHGLDVNDAVDAHGRARPDPRAVEDGGAGREEDIVGDLAAREVGSGPDQYVVADADRIASDAADHSGVHDDAIGTDHNRSALGREYGSKADGCVRTDGDIATHDSRRRYARRCVDVRRDSAMVQKH